jgi:hypothetical protein
LLKEQQQTLQEQQQKAKRKAAAKQKEKQQQKQKEKQKKNFRKKIFMKNQLEELILFHLHLVRVVQVLRVVYKQNLNLQQPKT